jgi:hypothetical protein
VIEPSAGNVNWNGDVNDVLDEDGGVDDVGEMERLLGKRYGVVSK